MNDKKSGLGWAQWIMLAVIGVALPLAACRRSLSGPIDVPLLADILTTAFYAIALVSLGVVLAVSLPQSRE